MSDSGDMGSKVCPQCGQTLPLHEFHGNRRRQDGLAYYCKRCASVRSEQSRRRRGIQERRRSAGVVPEGSKWCPDCEQVKPMTEFAKTRAKVTGYHSYCLLCHNARGSESRLRLYGGSREYHLRRRYGLGVTGTDTAEVASATLTASLPSFLVLSGWERLELSR